MSDVTLEGSGLQQVKVCLLMPLAAQIKAVKSMLDAKASRSYP